MKTRIFPLLFFILITIFMTGKAFSQMPGGIRYNLKIVPEHPQTNDTIRAVLSYISADGCPDYELVLNSSSKNEASLSVRPIGEPGQICTQVVTPFKSELIIGIYIPGFKVRLDSSLIYNPVTQCILDKKGTVVQGSGACSDELFISETTPYATLLPVLYKVPGDSALLQGAGTKVKIQAGDKVIFSAGPIANTDTSYAQCALNGKTTCCVIISRIADCQMNKNGEVVAGAGFCAGKWFVKDLSPVYSYNRLYDFDNTKNLPSGAKVIFGVSAYPSTDTIINCRTYGKVRCYFLSQPVTADTLCGTAYTGDSILPSGMAMLFQKGIRKAMRACRLTNGKFEFPNLLPAPYTVYIIPDKVLKTDYLPTFYINKLSFRNADYYDLKDGRNEIAVNLRKFEKRKGNGKIHGNIFYETSNLKDSILNYYGEKGSLYTSDNNQAVNLPVVLFNSTGTPVAWTMSDESGNYSFENIPADTYRIVTENSESQAETTVSITPGSSDVGANIELKTTSVGQAVNTPVTRFTVYPNPVRDQLTVQLGSPASMTIFNSLGQQILHQTLNEGTNYIQTGTMPKGMYILKIGEATIKLLHD